MNRIYIHKFELLLSKNIFLKATDNLCAENHSDAYFLSLSHLTISFSVCSTFDVDFDTEQERGREPYS